MAMTEIVDAFRALGDPTRQKILGLLEVRGQLCVMELGRYFDMTQPSLSHHLRILRQAGLVSAHKRGKEVYYAINAEVLSRCCGAFFSKFACCQPLLGITTARRGAKKAKGEA